MTNLATKALKEKKIKKQEAMGMVESLHEGHTLTEKQFAQLYKFFVPPVARGKKMTNTQWVHLAASKRPAHKFLQHVYSDGEYEVATDADRLHYLKTDLPEGFYDQFRNKLDVDYNFPNWKSVLVSKKWEKVIALSELEITTQPTSRGIVTRYIIGGVHFNKKYIEDFANGDNEIKMSVTGRKDPASMGSIDGERNGVIMPINAG